MKRVVKLLLVISYVALLSACAKPPPQVPVQTIDANVVNSAQTGENKFSLGPHKGWLGVRQYYFACDSSLLPIYYYKVLRAHAVYLRQHSAAKIQVQGFTAAAGSREYNIAIGERRADAVANYLRLQGVGNNQISEVSFGAEMDKPYVGKVNTKNCRVDLIYTQLG